MNVSLWFLNRASKLRDFCPSVFSHMANRDGSNTYLIVLCEDVMNYYSYCAENNI